MSASAGVSHSHAFFEIRAIVPTNMLYSGQAKPKLRIQVSDQMAYREGPL